MVKLDCNKIIFEQSELLRGEMRSSNNKNLLLPLYSVKYLGDQNQIPEEMKIKQILKHESNLISLLKKTFAYIEKNIPGMKGVYDIFPEQEISKRLLFQLLINIDSLNFKKEDWATFVTKFLFKSYESEGKQERGLFSPESINQLGMSILRPSSGTFYDGTAGIGGFMVSASKIGKGLDLYGQEINHTSWALGKLHLLFYDRLNANLVQGDVLREPAFMDGENIRRFDFVMMDFPFSLDLTRYESLTNDKYNRFIYGNPSKRNGDMAFIMHALASMNSNGKGVLVVSNGALFRGGIDQSIRQNMIAADVIEAVISLPPGLYEETGIPTNLLVLNKNKPDDRRGEILFIDAESEFQSIKYRKYLDEKNITKIADAYHQGTETEKFSMFVPISEIEDANLLCSRYLIDTEFETEFFGKVQMVNEEESTQYQVNVSPLKKLSHEIYRGLNISAKSVDEVEGAGDFKVIKLSDVQGGEILIDELTSVSLKRNSRVDKYLVQEGDVIVSNRGSSIKIAVVPENAGDILLSHNFLGIRCENNIDPYYLKAYLESPLGMFHLTSSQTGTNILTINPKNLEDIPIKVIALDKQREIGEGFVNVELNYKEKIRLAEEEKTNQLLNLYEQMEIRDSFKILK
ncbi:N-6 DNA methylase [Bacillaceae bacterium S4-13-58]